MRRASPVTRALLLAAVVASLGACGSDDDGAGSAAGGGAGLPDAPTDEVGAPTDGPPEPSFEVSVRDGGLRDRLRGRDVPYRVYAPVGASGPAPVVLVSHGGTGNRTGFTTGEHVGRALAGAGFLAIHVGHLPSVDLATHLVDRPADVSVVLDRLEDGELALPEAFAGTPDTSRVGHAGHSFGAYTAHAVGGATFDRTFTDARVLAIAPISPQGAGQFNAFDRGPEDNTWATVTIPAFNLVGSEEIDGNDIGSVDEPGWRLVPFSRYPAEGDKFLTVVEGQGHRDMWNLGDETVKAYIAGELVRFFSIYVAGDPTLSACDIGGPGAVEATTERRADADASALLGCG